MQIEAKPNTFTSKTIRVTELRLVNDGKRLDLFQEFSLTPLLKDTTMSFGKGGGFVVTENDKNVSSISIFPQGKKELGHSFVVSF